MNLIATFLVLLSIPLIKSRFKKIVFNDTYAKLLIISGAIKWYDLPHLHHPLIHLRINYEYAIGRN